GGLSDVSNEASEIELLNKLKGHINATLDTHHETLDDSTLKAVQNLYVLLKVARKKGLSSDTLNRYELTKRVDFSTGEYGSQTRQKDGSKSDADFNKTAWTSYLKSLIKYHEKQVKKSGGKIPDVSRQNQQRYLLKMAVKLRLKIDLDEDQITAAFNKTYTGHRQDAIHNIVDEIMSATTINPPKTPTYGVGGAGLDAVPTPPQRKGGDSPKPPIRTSGNTDAPVSSHLSIPNSKPEQSKDYQLRDLQNQLVDLKDRFRADNSMIDGGEVDKYFHQLDRVMQRLLSPDEELMIDGNSAADDSEKLIETLADVAEKAFEVNDFYPRANQLLSVLMFAQGKDSNALGQIRTGQGKTLIAAMTAIVRQQVYEQDIVIISTTEPLAEDGAKDQKALYDACKVPVSYFSDQEKKIGTNELQRPRVIYATSFSLESDKLRQEKVSGYRKGEPLDRMEPKLNIWPNSAESKPKVCFVVDECDSVLYDNAGSVIRSSGPLPFAKEIQAIATDIAIKVKEDPTKEKQVIKGAIKDLVDKKINGNKTLQLYVNSHLDGWIDDALAVFNQGSNFRDGVNYVKSESIGSFIDASYAPLTRSVGYALEGANKTRFEQIARQLSASLIKQENGKSVLNSTSKLSSVRRYFAEYLNFIYQQVNNKAIVPDESLQGLWQKVHGLYKAIDQKCKESGSTKFTLKDMYPNEIYYVDEATGQIIPKMRFEGLKHLFMEFKEYGKITLKPSTALDYQSQLGLLLDGQCMVGFTGSLPDATLDPLNHLEFKSMLNIMYGADVPCAMVPDFKRRERIDLPPIQCLSEDDAQNKTTWETEIERNIESRTTTQPILLVCETIEDANEFEKSLKKDGRTIKMYTDKKHADVAAAAHGANTVIITTRIGSRGTDWRVADDCKASGLHVICTFPPGDARQRAQIQGRAGRSGSPGSTIEITHKPPPENNVKAKDGLVRAIMDELFSQMFYQLEQSVKEDKKDDLKLWFSIDDVRNKLTKEVKEAIEIGKNKADVIEIIKQKILPSEGNTGVIFKDWFEVNEFVSAIAHATDKIKTCLDKYFDVLTRLLVKPKATDVEGLAALDEMNTLSELTQEQRVLQQIDEFIQQVNSEEFTEHLSQKDVTDVFDLIQEVGSGATLMKQITPRLKPEYRQAFDKLIDDKLNELLLDEFNRDDEGVLDAKPSLSNDTAFLRAFKPKDTQQIMKIIAKAAELQAYELLYRYLDDEELTAELINPTLTGPSYLPEIIFNAIGSMPRPQFKQLLSHNKIGQACTNMLGTEPNMAVMFVSEAIRLGKAGALNILLENNA
ncbi:MAG: DEAD/DEAH box helicase, partial [Candidatus Margulisiibacteriota bacterium]|nr:DEAD/DEAH box helicase [Candidatus Margulisiibacteriota bacterium]